MMMLQWDWYPILDVTDGAELIDEVNWFYSRATSSGVDTGGTGDDSEYKKKEKMDKRKGEEAWTTFLNLSLISRLVILHFIIFPNKTDNNNIY